MILAALNRYYERLDADPQQNVAPLGFSRQKISFCVVVEPDGALHAFEPVVAEVVRGRALPQPLVVPGQTKPPGQGLNPCFLWDNASYILGQVPEGRRPRWARERFEAFRKRHLATERAIGDPAFSAVCRFLEDWDPDRVADHHGLAEMTHSFGVFRLRAERGYVHERPDVLKWWHRQARAPDEERTGTCLVTGQTAVLARLHKPEIKGVVGAQSSGAKIVSFNCDAFESYGKDQSYNSPVAERVAFQYGTALNHLLDDRTRRVQIADATTVFWAEEPTPAERVVPSLFGGSARASPDAEDAETLARIHAFLDRLRQGRGDPRGAELGDPDTPFYILGLSANRTRISVRYWLTSTVGQLSVRLARHLHDLEIIGLGDRPPTLHELLRETAPPKKGWADESRIPKLLAGGLVRAVLTDRPYPPAFYAAILRRIQVEHFAVPDKRKDWRPAMARRAAAVKACLVRNFGKEIPVSLDPERPEPAYQLGRWFALLEKAQKEALGEKLNTTIKDRFYTAASATPAAVFPRLIQLSQHHMARIDKRGLRVTREKQIQQIASRLDAFPPRLNPEAQGLFHLGYYHQTQDLYTPKAAGDADQAPADEKE